jgi:hypothetical protein
VVDFRYHLISLIGVILALALGILAGSGFLGGPILEQLQDDVDNFRTEARRFQGVISEQDRKLDQAEDFARAAEQYMVRGRLAGDEIVLFQFEGTEGRVVDGVRAVLTEAGAQVVTQITLTSKLAIASAPAQDELSLITGSLSGDPASLLADTATMLGARAAAAANDTGQADTPNTTAMQRFQSFLDELEVSEFVGSDVLPDARAVPPDAQFVVIGGAPSRPPFDVAGFVAAFAESLSERGAPTIFVEGSTSEWDLVSGVRADIEARASSATVDNAETTMGRIAVVLGLDQAGAGNLGHFGVLQGTTVIPDPNPSV